jgi:two-component system sensor histidine kinase SenX3
VQSDALEKIVSPEVRRVLELLPEAWFVASVEGKVIGKSESAEEFGLIVLDQIEEEQTMELITEAHESKSSLEKDVLIPATRTHQEQTLRLRVSPMNHFHVLVLIEDLTEERRLDKVRRDFVANISHELKTPVGALALLAEAIQAGADDPAMVQHFSARMKSEADRLAELITSIIDLSRIQDTDVLQSTEELEVDDIVTEALDHVQLLAKDKEIEIVVGGTGNLKLWGNRQQLVSALRNLVLNAIHYSARGDRVAIGTDYSDGFVEISVVDQGIGVPQSEQERIFERFYRVDPARSRVTGGTGLGLAIVKNVCQGHGGSCTLWSEPGHGSTFTMKIPERNSAVTNKPVILGENE